MSYQGNGVWVVAEGRKGKLLPTAYELVTAAKALGAQRGEPVTAVVVGAGADAAESLAACGVSKAVVLSGLPELVDDAVASALAAVIKAAQPRTVLLPADVFGRSVAPRLAVLLGSGLASDATALELDADKRLVVRRAGFAGNVMMKVLVKSPAGPELATVRPLSYPRAGTNGSHGAVETSAAAPAGKTAFVSFAPDTSGEIDMGAADKIVSGGRGLGNPEGFAVIRDLAHALGAAVGASRAAVDSGWIPYKHQVGITGRSVRPKLYIAVGISGQIQHMGGMKSSDVIVAINSDADCPMMKAANYAVQGDLYKVLPALIAEIKKARGA